MAPRCAWAWLGSLVGLLSLPSQLAATAWAGYSLDGIPAPQIQPNPVAPALAKQLRERLEAFRRAARPASLQEAIELGLLSNPGLARNYAGIQGSSWNLIAVRRQWYPVLTVGGSGPAGVLLGRSWTGTTTTTRLNPPVPVIGTAAPVATVSGYTNSDDAGLGLSVGWTFFDPQRDAAIQSAASSLRSSRLLFDISARNLVLDLQQRYFRLQEQVALISLYSQIYDATSLQVKLSEERFNAGLVNIGDVEQIRTSQYAQLTRLMRSYQQLIEASAALAEAMALPDGVLPIPADAINQHGAWEKSLHATETQALQLREEILRSLVEAEGASWSSVAAFNSYWPQLNLSATTTGVNSSISEGVNGTLAQRDQARLQWNGSVGIGFNWTPFDGGVAAAQGMSQRSIALQLRQQAAEQRLQIMREVKTAYATFQAATLALQSTAQQVRSAENALRAVRRRYSVGVADMTTIVQTLNQALEASDAYVSATSDYNVAVASLYRVSAEWPPGSEAPLATRIEKLRWQ